MAITISDETKKRARQVPFSANKSRFMLVDNTTAESISPKEGRVLPVSIWFLHEEVLFEFLTPKMYKEKPFEVLLKLAKRHSEFKLFVTAKDNVQFLTFVEECRQGVKPTQKAAEQMLEDSLDEVKVHAKKILNALPSMNITPEVVEASKQVVEGVLDTVMNQPKLVGLLSKLLTMDGEFLDHAMATSLIASAIAKASSMNPEHVKTLAMGAFLHDIGQYRLPSNLLNNDELAGDDFEKFKSHTVLGQDLLDGMSMSGVRIPPEAEVVVLQHHERFNGCGYPNNKKGRQEEVGASGIHYYARIVGVADRYVELMEQQHRSSGQTSQSMTLARMFRQDGSFDPKILDVLKEIIKAENT